MEGTPKLAASQAPTINRPNIWEEDDNGANKTINVTPPQEIIILSAVVCHGSGSFLLAQE